MFLHYFFFVCLFVVSVPCMRNKSLAYLQTVCEENGLHLYALEEKKTLGQKNIQDCEIILGVKEKCL